jgi:hypothetical protein
MMPMFLQRSNGTVLGTTISSFWAPTSVDLAIGRLSDLAIQNFNPGAIFNHSMTRSLNDSIPHHR